MFIFGFESPTEYLSNERDGTDFESSWAVWIGAKNADIALEWGRQIAEEFVDRLFEQAGFPKRSWTDHGFAHWVSTEPAELERARSEASIQKVAAGKMPDFSWALAHWSH